MLNKIFYAEELKKAFMWIAQNRRLWLRSSGTDANMISADDMIALIGRLQKEGQYLLIFILLCGEYVRIDTDELMFRIYADTILDGWSDEMPDTVIRQLMVSIKSFEQEREQLRS